MNHTEYLAELKRIDEESNRLRKKAARDYVLANSPYKEGDIVTDHIGSLRIERIRPFVGLTRTPEAVYSGVELTKKGVPCKNQTGRGVYQSNLIHDVDAF